MKPANLITSALCYCSMDIYAVILRALSMTSTCGQFYPSLDAIHASKAAATELAFHIVT